jgi:serine/threonine-protein kinase
MEPLAQTTPTPLPQRGQEPAGPDLSGRTVGDFNVIRRLGQGGMGQVYLAEQVSLKRKVALKVLRPDLARNEQSLARFKAEAEAVARLTHANVVQVYYIGAVDDLPYMALEYVEGKNLREYLEKKGPVELPLGLSIMRQVAGALTRAGELGIVHRDIKPDNILLTRKGEVKVADFGLSRVLTGDAPLNLTQSGVTMGTPLYMAPEQAEGKPVDCRADIYSFGVTSYHMLAGEPPFRGATAVEVALQHITAQPAPLNQLRPDLPPAVCALVQRMMAKRPEDRFETARDLLREIMRLREGTSALVPVSSSLQSVDVELVRRSASEGPVAAAVASSATQMADVALPRPWPRWLLLSVATVSIAFAALAGVALARVGQPSSRPLPRGVAGENADVDPPSRDDEPALRRTAEIYISAGAGKDVSVGMSLCSRLAILYLEQHRLDEADKLFARLENADKVPSYHAFGGLGRSIVLGLQSKPVESNKGFQNVAGNLPQREADTSKGVPKRPDPEIVKLLQNPSFLYWLAQAVRYNHVNGLPDDQVPPPLRRLLELNRRS